MWIEKVLQNRSFDHCCFLNLAFFQTCVTAGTTVVTYSRTSVFKWPFHRHFDMRFLHFTDVHVCTKNPDQRIDFILWGFIFSALLLVDNIPFSWPITSRLIASHSPTSLLLLLHWLRWSFLQTLLKSAPFHFYTFTSRFYWSCSLSFHFYSSFT